MNRFVGGCVREDVTWMSGLDDAVLLRRAARGDGLAFTELHDRLAPMLVLRLRRRCADDDMVADVVQETFIAAWRAAGSWDGRGDVGAWVWTIAVRRLVDAFRRRAARVSTVPLEDDDAVQVRRRIALADSAEDQVMAGVLGGPVEAAIAGLSPELRAVLQATVLDGLSVREAAVVLGIPEGTVKTRAMRARVFMKEALA
jgi:RNA polymerase sigma-70 factor (ECF subfamily)